MAAGAAGIYQGPCSGHGTGSGSTHHPGLGGSILEGCAVPSPATDPKIVPKSVALMNATTSWLPLLQAPIATLKRTVFINKIFPITDQDLLTLHPTETMHQVMYTGVPKGCPPATITNPAWWCTIGATLRETKVGHARKHFATQKTVFIDGKRASVFGDPLGDGTPAFPCSSVVTGASKNVFIGMATGGI